mmetsp:Transcript_7423/g.17924  ORF Transcript_7423/g.17924 Transcript_7423/m.17924 type:complete len:232 (-) Transcript_7423:2234-2929(-)
MLFAPPPCGNTISGTGTEQSTLQARKEDFTVWGSFRGFVSSRCATALIFSVTPLRSRAGGKSGALLEAVLALRLALAFAAKPFIDVIAVFLVCSAAPGPGAAAARTASFPSDRPVGRAGRLWTAAAECAIKGLKKVMSSAVRGGDAASPGSPAAFFGAEDDASATVAGAGAFFTPRIGPFMTGFFVVGRAEDEDAAEHALLQNSAANAAPLASPRVSLTSRTRSRSASVSA